jgi:hypothetical protein
LNVRDTGWFKSKRSDQGGDNCVEVRITDVATQVRDSKNPGVSMTVDLAALVAAVRSGRY